MNILEIGVKLLIINAKGKFLGLKRRKEAYQLAFDESFDIPGGRIEFGEEPIIGLLREVKEETGLEIPVNRIFLLDCGNIVKTDEFQIVRLTFYYQLKYDNVKIYLGNEHIHYEWLEMVEDVKYHSLLNHSINKYKQLMKMYESIDKRSV